MPTIRQWQFKKPKIFNVYHSHSDIKVDTNAPRIFLVAELVPKKFPLMMVVKSIALHPLPVASA
uniref:Uncharacterized protein n=1 Tax=Cucumis sativus TaxID=3659 RepID=A0A0A0K3T6_CUCSA